MALPGRLKKFSAPEIERAMSAAFNRITSCAGTGPALA